MKMIICAMISGFLCFSTALSAKSESFYELTQQLEKSFDKERDEWLQHFSEDGKWIRDYKKLTEEEQGLIRYSRSMEENVIEMRAIYQDIPKKIADYEARLAEFRNKKAEATSSYRSHLFKISGEKSELFNKYSRDAKMSYDRKYSEMIDLGNRLKKYIEKSKSGN